jgi:Rrf2 family protein
MADYAVRLMIEVAAEGQASAADVARRQHIPYQFLRKVGTSLAAARLLTAERGIKGGFRLARPAEQISLLDILRVMDRPALNRCTVDPAKCERRSICGAYPAWVSAQLEIERILASYSLSDLVAQQRRRCQTTGARQARRTSQKIRTARLHEPLVIGCSSADATRKGGTYDPDHSA